MLTDLHHGQTEPAIETIVCLINTITICDEAAQVTGVVIACVMDNNTANTKQMFPSSPLKRDMRMSIRACEHKNIM